MPEALRAVRLNLARLDALLLKASSLVETDAESYAGEYEGTSAAYWSNIYEAAYDYLTSSGSIARYRNAARRAVVEAFPPAFYAGYADAGGDETEDEDESWLTGRMNQELGFVDSLFAALREKRAEGKLSRDEADAEASTRADGYRATLNSIYNEGKLRGAGNKSLTWRLGKTEVHCDTCSRLDGQRHGAKWWRKNGYKPREPGSETLDCKGYNCDCLLEDDEGNEFVI